jgi:hypothetical protein
MPQHAGADPSGWVESISSLSEEHPATALLLGSPRSQAADSSKAAAAAVKSGSSAAVPSDDTYPERAVGSSAGLSPVGVKMSVEAEFEACLEHALGVLLAEVTDWLMSQQSSWCRCCLNSTGY